MFYTGIGARKTPNHILQRMAVYGAVLAKLGLTLRSGAADGADAAFEFGCDKNQGKKEIYLPWKNFNNHNSQLYNICESSLMLAQYVYGERFDTLTRPVKNLMARNCYQVSGSRLDLPSEFVICYTIDGCSSFKDRTAMSGGTGQAISYASMLNIPIFNLRHNDTEEKLKKLITFLYQKFGDIK